MLRVQQHSPRVLQRFLQLTVLERLLALLGECLDADAEFLLEHPDALEIILDLRLLLAGLAQFVVIGGYSRDVLEHPPTCPSGHDGELRHIALEHDVVAVSAGTGLGEQPTEFGGGGGAVVEVVGGVDVVLASEFDRPREPHFIGIHLQTPPPTVARTVAEHEGRLAELGSPALLPAVVDQLLEVLRAQALR